MSCYHSIRLHYDPLQALFIKWDILWCPYVQHGSCLCYNNRNWLLLVHASLSPQNVNPVCRSEHTISPTKSAMYAPADILKFTLHNVHFLSLIWLNWFTQRSQIIDFFCVLLRHGNSPMIFLINVRWKSVFHHYDYISNPCTSGCGVVSW